MSAFRTVYRLGEHLIVVLVAVPPNAGDPHVASAYRLVDDALARVQMADGSAFEVSAPTAWEAKLRFVARLEAYLGGRAFEQKDDAPEAAEPSGSWRLPA